MSERKREQRLPKTRRLKSRLSALSDKIVSLHYEVSLLDEKAALSAEETARRQALERKICALEDRLRKHKEKIFEALRLH